MHRRPRSVNAFPPAAGLPGSGTCVLVASMPRLVRDPSAHPAPRPEVSPRSSRWLLRLAVAGCLLLPLVAAGGWWLHGWLRDWRMLVQPLPPAGGLYFPVTVLHDVPHFLQDAPPWGRDRLAGGPTTLGQEGCAVASAAMVLASYGYDTDPGRLNRYLQAHQGYTDRGWLYWEKASDHPPGTATKAYEDAASHYLIDLNLLRGNPVIVRLRYPSGVTHFVVIVGKQGFEYLVRDPGAGGARGLYPLSEFGSPIEALRFYHPPPLAPVGGS